MSDSAHLRGARFGPFAPRKDQSVVVGEVEEQDTAWIYECLLQDCPLLSHVRLSIPSGNHRSDVLETLSAPKQASDLQ